jgi:FixJ family two-component response regulator
VTAAKEQAHHIIVVDDDESVRDALSSLFRSVGYAVATHSSAAAVVTRPANKPASKPVVF